MNIKKYFINGVFFLVVSTLILFIACTAIPNTYKEMGFSDTNQYNVEGGGTIELNKAVIADACEKDRINCLENVLLIQGLIDEGTISSIKKLASLNDVETICFRSRGGYNDKAQMLMSYIKDNDINTCLAEEYYIEGKGSISGTYCKSACPLILLMGKERFHIGNEITIGIHHSGKVLDFCFTCILFDSGGEGFMPFFSDESHIKLFERSRKTPLKNMDFLQRDEWKEYNIFTNG